MVQPTKKINIDLLNAIKSSGYDNEGFSNIVIANKGDEIIDSILFTEISETARDYFIRRMNFGDSIKVPVGLLNEVYERVEHYINVYNG